MWFLLQYQLWLAPFPTTQPKSHPSITKVQILGDRLIKHSDSVLSSLLTLMTHPTNTTTTKNIKTKYLTNFYRKMLKIWEIFMYMVNGIKEFDLEKKICKSRLLRACTETTQDKVCILILSALVSPCVKHVWVRLLSVDTASGWKDHKLWSISVLHRHQICLVITALDTFLSRLFKWLLLVSSLLATGKCPLFSWWRVLISVLTFKHATSSCRISIAMGLCSKSLTNANITLATSKKFIDFKWFLR